MNITGTCTLYVLYMYAEASDSSMPSYMIITLPESFSCLYNSGTLHQDKSSSWDKPY